MAPVTILACCRLVHIAVAIVAQSSWIRKKKCSVALPAVYLFMLSCERKVCFVVIERIDLSIELPSFRTMTDIAADLKIGTMRLFLAYYQNTDEN